MSPIAAEPTAVKNNNDKSNVGPGSQDINGTGVLDSSLGRSSAANEKATHETHATLADVPKAPDGGLQAWLQVLGGFFIYFNTWYLFFFPESHISLEALTNVPGAL